MRRFLIFLAIIGILAVVFIQSGKKVIDFTEYKRVDWQSNVTTEELKLIAARVKTREDSLRRAKTLFIGQTVADNLDTLAYIDPLETKARELIIFWTRGVVIQNTLARNGIKLSRNETRTAENGTRSFFGRTDSGRWEEIKLGEAESLESPMSERENRLINDWRSNQ